jgi:hypothetical protein
MQENISDLWKALKVAQSCATALRKPYWVLRSPASKDAPTNITFTAISLEELSGDAATKKFAKWGIEEKFP